MNKITTLKYDMRNNRLRRIITYKNLLETEYTIKIFPRFINDE